MSWPLSQDYNEAVQNPAANFADADLKAGQVATNALGLPMPYSGNFADVYQFACPGGQRWAVKCFTREVPGLRQRYEAISAHLRRANLPFTVDFTYLESGVLVGGRWYPVLKMEWVEGLTLNQFVKKAADKPATLDGLLHIWARMGTYLRSAGVAHADLQHGNVLLVPAAGSGSMSLKLVDYDGMWVPALAGGESGEIGHPAYQHPRRARDATYSGEVDRFPLLLVATALSALKGEGRSLWEKYDDGDNLLFTQADLEAPTKSRAFYDLLHAKDPATVALAKQMIEALRGGLESAPLLEELMPEAARPTAVPAPSPKPAARPKTQVVALAKPHAPPPGKEPEAPEPPPVRGPVIRPPAAAGRGRRRGVPAFAWVVGMIALALVATGVVAVVALRNSDEPPAPGTGGQVAQHRGGSQGGHPTSTQKRSTAPQPEAGGGSGSERVPPPVQEDVAITWVSDGRHVHTPKYDAVIANDGNLTNLKIDNAEFFKSGVDFGAWQSRGAYVYDEGGTGVLTLPNVEQSSGNVVTAASDKALVRHEFHPSSIKWTVRNNSDQEQRFYIVFDKAVRAVTDGNGQWSAVPPPLAPGAGPEVGRRNWPNTAWFAGRAKLTLTGATLIYAQWPSTKENYQVWQLTVPPHEKREAWAEMGEATPDEEKKVAEAAGPPTPLRNPDDPETSPKTDPDEEKKRKLEVEAGQRAAEAKKKAEEDAAKQLQDARKLFAKADKALQGGDAEEAERLQAEAKKALRAIKDKYPKTPAAKDADDEVAAARRLKDAADLFTKAAKDRRDGKSAMADQTEEGAVGALRQIISMYPRTQAAEKAKDRLRELGQPEK